MRLIRPALPLALASTVLAVTSFRRLAYLARARRCREGTRWPRSCATRS